jgi:hypothetical protein
VVLFSPIKIQHARAIKPLENQAETMKNIDENWIKKSYRLHFDCKFHSIIGGN